MQSPSPWDGSVEESSADERIEGIPFSTRRSGSAQRGAVIHVVDDDYDCRTAVSRLLAAAGYEVRTYANAGDFLLSRTLDSKPGCILLDLHLPGPDGFTLQAELTRQGEPLPIIFISGETDVADVVQAMRAGAEDFLCKPVDRATLFDAIERALARDAQQRPVRAQLEIWRRRYESLTSKELAVFDRVICGRLNKEIAAELSAAERTIKAHRAQVMRKMGADSLAELVHIAGQLRNGGRRTVRNEGDNDQGIGDSQTAG